MIPELIAFVARIWEADIETRSGGAFGTSETEKRSHRITSWLCGGAIALLVVAGGAWIWLTK